MTELTGSERAALRRVGVDPDARPQVMPETPAPVAVSDFPPSWLPVISQARADLEPRQIAGFFETPQPDLEDVEGAAMTPAAWLAEGRDVEAVIALIRFL